VPERRAQLLAGGLELAAHAAHPARPRVLAQRVDHRAPDAALGECLELDAAAVVEAVGRIDETDHAILHEIAEINGVRHGRGHATRQRLNEGQSGFHAVRFCGRLGTHFVRSSSGPRVRSRQL